MNNNNKIDTVEKGQGAVDCIDLTEVMDQWMDVNAVMNLRFP
jgi:hypothetical protein